MLEIYVRLAREKYITNAYKTVTGSFGIKSCQNPVGAKGKLRPQRASRCEIPHSPHRHSRAVAAWSRGGRLALFSARPARGHKSRALASVTRRGADEAETHRRPPPGRRHRTDGPPGDQRRPVAADVSSSTDRRSWWQRVKELGAEAGL